MFCGLEAHPGVVSAFRRLFLYLQTVLQVKAVLPARYPKALKAKPGCPFLSVDYLSVQLVLNLQKMLQLTVVDIVSKDGSSLQ